MAGRVRIGAVAYLNSYPLVHGLQRGLGADRVELSLDVPAVLSDRMLAGQLDIALLPVIELARMPDLELVPGLGIVTRGPSRSVLLVSRRPIDAVRSVALDPESRTSNALVRVLCAHAWGVEPQFHVGPTGLREALEDADAVVRIGDKALFGALPEGCEAHDLGTAWTRGTGLPFVFAAWAARPGVVDREVYQVLHDSRREGCRALDEIAAGFTWNGVADPELARDYLSKNILYRLGSAELLAMKTFLEAAAGLGLIEAAPEIRLALQRKTGCHEELARRGALSRSDP